MGGARAALPTPAWPSSVKISTITQPWKVKVCMEDSGSVSRSIGLVQKCGGKGTVLPRQRTALVRISLIFMGLLHDWVSVANFRAMLSGATLGTAISITRKAIT